MPLDDSEGILGHWGDIVVAIAFLAVAVGILSSHSSTASGRQTRKVGGSPTVPSKSPLRAIFDTFQAIRLTRQSLVSIRKAQFERAIAECTEAHRLNPRFSAAQQSWALRLRLREFERAIADLNEAIRLRPKSAKAFVNRSHARLETHDYDQAIADASEAIRLNRKSVGAFNLRGLAFANKGAVDQAFADLNEALRLNSKQAIVLHNRATVWRKLGNFDKARADCDAAIHINPKLAWAFSSAGLPGWAPVNSSARWSTSTRQFASSRTWRSHDVIVRMPGTKWGSSTPRLQTAMRCSGRESRCAEAFRNRGIASSGKRDYEAALSDFAEAIHLKPDTGFSAFEARAWTLATCLHQRYRDGKQAVQDATRACELESWKNPDFLAALSAAYAEAGDFDAAFSWLAKADELRTHGARMPRGSGGSRSGLARWR